MWEYLDEMDKNLLYDYARVLNGGRLYCDERGAYYLIWFVYRYVIGSKTYGESLRYANEETFRKHRLYTFINHGYISIGEIRLGKKDIPVILEILYNRYDFMEQLECYIRHMVRGSVGYRRALEYYDRCYAVQIR